MTHPSPNQATLRQMVEDRIFQLTTATLGVFAIALMVWVLVIVIAPSPGRVPGVTQSLRNLLAGRPNTSRAPRAPPRCTLVALIFIVLLAYAQKHDEFCRQGHLLRTHAPCGSLSSPIGD
jgi:hypothetical protein